MSGEFRHTVGTKASSLFCRTTISRDFGPRVQSLGRTFEGVLEQTTGLNGQPRTLQLVAERRNFTKKTNTETFESVLAALKA